MWMMTSQAISVRPYMEVREKFIAEREEQERIRSMTEEEKVAWLAANPKDEGPKEERSKMGFMQKYYHKAEVPLFLSVSILGDSPPCKSSDRRC
jgi:hypothetical protein